ncbi:general transcription factor II-I repeat domain-containing protein 2A [Trichonephila clavipes]|nr:general transcription factor II-I repeat domain-containing protein 2A [Trichonephila clavipes]
MFLYLETKKDRILKLAEHVTDQQKKDINSAPFISLCLDESIDISKSAHLAVFARYCVGNIIKEELSAITTLLTTTEFFFPEAVVPTRRSLVYADKPQTLDHFEDNIRRVIADIRPQMLEKVIEN